MSFSALKFVVAASRSLIEQRLPSFAVCYMAEGQIDINALLVEQGWALAYRRYSMDYVDEENTAKASRAGMWAGEFMKPWEWRKK